MIVFIKEGEDYGLICTVRFLEGDSSDFNINHFRFFVLNGCWDGEYYDGMFSVDYTGTIREGCTAIIDEAQFPEWTEEYVKQAKAKQRHYEKFRTFDDIESDELSDDLPF